MQVHVGRDAHDLMEHSGVVFVVERGKTCQHFVEEHADAKNVQPVVVTVDGLEHFRAQVLRASTE